MAFSRGFFRRIRGARRAIARGVAPKPQLSHVRGIEIRLAIDTEIEDFRSVTYADKEPETLDWIDRWCQPGDVLYDVGANVGLYTLYAAKRGATVFAFEPEALNFAALNRNLSLNAAATVTAVPVAVGEQMQFDTIFSHDFSTGAALHAIGRPVDQEGRAFTPRHRQSVFVVPIDDLCGRHGLPVPAHIKIDVDGFEAQVLRGARATLGEPRLKTVLVEVSGAQPEIDEMMSDFTVVARTDSVRAAHAKSENRVYAKRALAGGR